MSRPGTVFADYDENLGKLVFGVENPNAITGIQRSLAARGLSADEYLVVTAEPIHRLASLQSSIFESTQGGIQIHFGGYLCTLGFNVTSGGTRSFITNSHCTNEQGGTEGTTYYQPTSSIAPIAIATEADDPEYSGSLSGCSAGKRCRLSDASRAAYSAARPSSQGIIAKTTGVNSGSLTTAGAFTVTGQDDSNNAFSGDVDKVGRTTGWTRGAVTNTCATVNVSQSDIQLLCQTMVYNRRAKIVGSGDSGSPVFKQSGGDNVQLIGILWGGSGSSTFVFSPLKNVQQELGSFDAVSAGGGGGGGGGDGGEDPPCIPAGKSGKCK